MDGTFVTYMALSETGEHGTRVMSTSILAAVSAAFAVQCARPTDRRLRHVPKFVFMPPQDDDRRLFAARLAETVPEYDVASPETDDEALEAVRDADAGRQHAARPHLQPRPRRPADGGATLNPTPSSSSTCSARSRSLSDCDRLLESGRDGPRASTRATVLGR